MTYFQLSFAAYDGPDRFIVSEIDADTYAVEGQHRFEDLSEARAFVDEMNNTTEWQWYCRTAVEGE
jgi:hypothetical protein